MIGKIFQKQASNFVKIQKFNFSISIGSKLPEGTLTEFLDQEQGGCSLGPNAFKVSEISTNKNIAIFAVPGAFTPTCSASHVPGYLNKYDDLKSAGIDEIWCLSVNDPFVMGAWGRDQKTQGKIRMLADGSATYTAELGQIFDLTEKGLGKRSQRYSMLVSNGEVKSFNLDQPGKFEVSDADTLLSQAKKLL